MGVSHQQNGFLDIPEFNGIGEWIVCHIRGVILEIHVKIEVFFEDRPVVRGSYGRDAESVKWGHRAILRI